MCLVYALTGATLYGIGKASGRPTLNSKRREKGKLLRTDTKLPRPQTSLSFLNHDSEGMAKIPCADHIPSCSPRLDILEEILRNALRKDLSAPPGLLGCVIELSLAIGGAFRVTNPRWPVTIPNKV
ncbi:hypothetical protein BDW62DRAFT_26582 [Aspergillus aurantiobrunneus]